MSSVDPRHHTGQSVDTVDQVSSITLAGLAIAGGVTAVLLIELLVR